jgi:YidC/Oxa1 family membrane protein insertase
MNKNLFLALALSLGVYVLWFKWYNIKHPRPTAEQETVAVREQEAKASPSTSVIDNTGDSLPIKKHSNTDVDMEKWAKSDTVEIKNHKAKFVFNTKGAGIVSYIYNGPTGEVELAKTSYPGFFATMPDKTFKVQKKGTDFIVFTTKLDNGLILNKKFKWNESGLNELEFLVRNTTSQSRELSTLDISMGPGMGTVKNEIKENAKLWKAVFAYNKKGRKHPVLENLKKETPTSDILWTGVQNRYFLAAIIPQTWEYKSLEYFTANVKTYKGKLAEAPGVVAYSQKTVLSPGESKLYTLKYYIGPKDYRKLAALGHGLDRSVELGFFAPLGKLALKALFGLHKITKNYGWALIILTIFLQILMFPLTQKSIKASQGMKKVQGELKILQEKYKDDKTRLNTEMMALYKKHGVNPLGGCLPMLLQIPVFFALFTALRNSWDLHGSGWIFWITDLSSKDPYYVLPILMGAVMFYQQKITMASTGDATSNAMMKWMPIVFTFMFLNFPSGLVLYWFTNSLMNLVLNLFMNKRIKTA